MTQEAPILVAEDDKVMVKLLATLVHRLGRELHHVSNGDAVLGKARELRPALLILDLNIPQRHGIEVLRLLRRDPELGRTPVLVLTAQGQPETEDTVREAGADDFLSKPVDLRTLFDRIQAMLPPQGEGA